MTLFVLWCIVSIISPSLVCCSSLYPYETETREVKVLDGLWTFCVTPRNAPEDVGFSKKWYSHDLSDDKMVCLLCIYY